MKASLGLFAGLYFCLAASAGVRDDIAVSIVFIQSPVPQTTMVNTAKLELGVRLAGTTNLFTPLEAVSRGTGFLIADDSRRYLVTANHVATNFSSRSSLTINDGNSPFKLSALHFAGETYNDACWLHHPAADVSILPLYSTGTAAGKLNKHFFSIEWVAAATNAPSRDKEFNVLGFPLGLGADDTFSPISRRSTVSSGLLREGDSFIFLLEDPSTQGFSGAPVIEFGGMIQIGSIRTLGAPHPSCIGIISGTKGDETGGKMAVVVPAFYVLELVNKHRKSVGLATKPL